MTCVPATLPAGRADGTREVEWGVAPAWVPSLEIGIGVSCPPPFPGCDPFRTRRRTSLLIAGPDRLTKRRVCGSKTARACGCTFQAPRMELREKTLLGAIVIRRTRRFERTAVPVREANRGPWLAGPGSLSLRVIGTVGEETARPWKGLTRMTSWGEIGRPPWNLLLLIATEQFRPAGQFSGVLELPV